MPDNTTLPPQNVGIGSIDAQPVRGSVQSLLEQEQALANAKQSKIAALLDERVALAKSTETRLVEIAAELKSLGWHRSKTAKALTGATAGATVAK